VTELLPSALGRLSVRALKICCDPQFCGSAVKDAYLYHLKAMPGIKNDKNQS